MQPIVTLAEHHFDHMKAISTAAITLSPEVRKLCEQNKCGNYGKSWTCPPAVQPIAYFQEKIAEFDTFLVLYQVYNVKNSFDWRGMMAGGSDFKDRILALKKEIVSELPDLNFLIMGAGGCHLCDPCTYPTGEPCRNPDDAIVSVEASGIDVMKLMKDNGLKYYNGKNTVTFIGGIFFQQGPNADVPH